MTLSSGTRLGPYELLAPIGAGGMGEVYRARDTRLERTVAVKVLPSHLAASAESRQRFEREARTISQLSHPHICALYDVGREGETEYLVMEYLEGETLSDRLLKGALPLEQVLRFGTEIADALDKAHRSGIVHRDLKPGNVMLTRSGVKLLDFGLAKAMAVPSEGSGASLTALPTRAGSNLTQEGTILGTFQYMAPEQLEGKEADSRTDIFAFGTVLYEMATGQKTFSGRTQASLIAAIIERVPPPISTISPMTPPAFDRVVKTCLEKDPEDRWQTAHDVMLQLKWIAEGGSQAGLPVPAPGLRRNRERMAWITTGLLLLGLLAAIPFAIRGLRRGVEEPRVVKLSILPPEKTIILPGHFAVSPDGRSIAFVAVAPDGRSLLWVRPFRSLDAEPLPGTELAAFPFWSPDSRFIGFFADQKLKKVEASGGPPQVLCDAPNGRGGAWNRDDVILFAPTPTSPLYRVSAGGGEPSQATSLDALRQENSHRYPSFLTDGRHFLFYARSHRPENRAISLGSIDSREVRHLVGAGSNMAFVRPGFLLFVREGGALVARRFDERALKLAGDPVLVAENVRPADAIAAASFSVSEGGVLAYGSGASNAGQLVWMDRAGRQLGSIDHPGFLVDFRLSPDEKRVAMDLVDSEIGGRQIWLQEPARGVVTRFTFGALQDVTPIWSPDGSRIAFASNRGGPAGLHQIYQKHSSGAGTEEVILRENTQKFVTDWSRDGKFLLFDATAPKSSTRSDLWALALQGDRTPRPFVRTAFNETHGRFSPDGRWVAYVSDETGRPEVYVQSFPLSTGKWRISNEGGHQPTWRRDGKELFYFSRSRILHAVTVTSGSSSGLEAGPPRPLFPLPRTQAAGRSSYDVSADGQRFLVSADRERQASQPLHVVLNWTAELKP